MRRGPRQPRTAAASGGMMLALSSEGYTMAGQSCQVGKAEQRLSGQK